jgi:Fe-S-cluster containining protein
MQRHGECNSCGWCCQFVVVQRVTIPSSEVTPESEHFYGLRGAIKGVDGKLRLVQHAFVPCAAHDNIGKRCGSYETRPKTCETFPSLPEQIEGTPCSFWFEGDSGERRGGLGSPHATPPRFG